MKLSSLAFSQEIVENKIGSGRKGIRASGYINLQSFSQYAPQNPYTNQYSSEKNNFSSSTVLTYVRFLKDGLRSEFGIQLGYVATRTSDTFTYTGFPFATNNEIKVLESSVGIIYSLSKFILIPYTKSWFFTYGATASVIAGFGNTSYGSTISVGTTKVSQWSVSPNITGLLGISYFPSSRLSLDATIAIASFTYYISQGMTSSEGPNAPQSSPPVAKNSNLTANLFPGFSSGSVNIGFTYFLK